MSHIEVTLLGQTLQVECAPEEAQRYADLAAALNARFAGKALSQVALALFAENQAVAAALARARAEIDRLNELAAVAAVPTQPDGAKAI